MAYGKKNWEQEPDAQLGMMAPTVDVKGKKIVVTGVANGIGREIAEGLMKAGAEVYGVDLNQQGLDELSQKYRGRFKGFQVNLGAYDSPDFAGVMRKINHISGGQIDGVYMNAGVVKLSDAASFRDTPASEFSKIFDINAFSNVAVYQALEDSLAKSQDPFVVVTSSPTIGRTAGVTAAYAPSKQVLEGISVMMGESLKEKNENGLVVAIDPGRVQTVLRSELYNKEPHGAQPAPEDVVEPYLLAGSRNANRDLLHGQTVVTQNKAYQGEDGIKRNETTDQGFDNAIAIRPLYSEAEPTVLVASYDTARSRFVMDAPARGEEQAVTIGAEYSATTAAQRATITGAAPAEPQTLRRPANDKTDGPSRRFTGVR